MFIYKNTPTYDRYTSKKIGAESIKIGEICDYNGLPITEERPSFKIKFDYNHDSEPSWYEDNIDELINLLPEGQDDFTIKSQIFEEIPFIYNEDSDYISHSTYLIMDWRKEYANPKSKFYNCRDFAEAARIQRLYLIIKLLRNKTYTKEQFGLTDLDNIDNDEE